MNAITYYYCNELPVVAQMSYEPAHSLLNEMGCLNIDGMKA